MRYRPIGTAPMVPDYRPLVEVDAGRLVMPRVCTVTVHVTGEPGLMRATFDLELIGRRYETVRLEAVPPDGGGLDFEAVRRLKASSFIRHGVASLVVLESNDGDRYTSEHPIDNPDPLWPVALTYSVAHALGEPPTKAVAEQLNISRDAAAQRVKRAREAGYLPATEKGRAS